MAKPRVRRFVAQIHILYAGVVYEPGEAIEYPADAVPADLVKSGALKPAAKKPAANG